MTFETRYLLNDQVWSLFGYGYPDFRRYWMTVTKYFRDGNNGKKYVAFSSWGRRFSISTDLLKTASEDYYSNFYAYEIQPEEE